MQTLTARETEIAILVANDARSKDIQEKLGISQQTENAHRQNIYKKLGLHSSVGLCLWAIREGLVSLPDFKSRDAREADELLASIDKLIERLEGKKAALRKARRRAK